MAITEAQRRMLDEARAQQASVEKMPFRQAFQGATYNWGEEIEAAVRSVLPEALGGGEYEAIRDELRGRLAEYQRQYPGEALTAEIAGAFLPTVAAAVLPGGQGAAALRTAELATRGGRMMQGVKGATVAGGEGILSYGGAAEGELTADDIAPALASAATSIVGGKAAEKAISGAGALGSRVINFAREKMGTKAADAVQAELLRLAETSGRTVDDIVNDIMNGRVMAENATLAAAVRSLRSQQGPASTTIDEALERRATQTRQAATEELQEGLAPGMPGNVQKAINASDAELAKMESAMYKKAFGEVPNVSSEIAEVMLEYARLYPQAAARLTEKYRRRNIVPIFKQADDGALELARLPDLEDAEILRREIGIQARMEFKTPGQEGLAVDAKDAEQTFKRILDAEYPGLAEVRASAASLRGAKESYQEGKRVFSGSPDDAEILYDKAAEEGPEAVKAFQAGAMSQLRKMLSRRPGMTGLLADPERADGQILAIIFPNEGLESIQQRLSIAEGARDLRQSVIRGSMTAPQQQAAAREGTNLTMTDISGIAGGDPIAILSATRKMLGGIAPGLTDAQRNQVAEVLFSEDPQFVRRMMTNEAPIDEVLRKIQGALSMLGATARRTVAVEAGQVTQGEPSPATGLLGMQ